MTNIVLNADDIEKKIKRLSYQIIEKNINIRSHCEHHMAPITCVAHVAYITSKKVVGLSKIPRLVEAI